MEFYPRQNRPGSQWPRNNGPYIISPAEQEPEIKAMGISNKVTEKYGSDVLFESRMGLVGIQRKRFPDDFISSLRGDSRMARELQQMRMLDLGIWIIEGDGIWSSEGHLMYGGRYQYTLNELWGWQMSVSALCHNPVLRVSNTFQFVNCCHAIRNWANKSDHGSLMSRPKPGANWGEPGSVEWTRFFTEGCPGIGKAQSEKLVDEFGLMFELKPGVAERLPAVIGPHRAKLTMALFGVDAEKILEGHREEKRLAMKAKRDEQKSKKKGKE